jgi:hypothetical protein
MAVRVPVLLARARRADGREQGVGAGVTESQARDAGPGLGDDRIADLADGG